MPGETTYDQPGSDGRGAVRGRGSVGANEWSRGVSICQHRFDLDMCKARCNGNLQTVYGARRKSNGSTTAAITIKTGLR